MHPSPVKVRVPAILVLLVLAAAAPAATFAALQRQPDNGQRGSAPPNYDVRVQDASQLAAIIDGVAGGGASLLAAGRGRTQAVSLALEELRRERPALDWRISPLIGGPEVVSSRRGALSAPDAQRSGEQIARDFFRRHAAIYGLSTGQVDELRFLGESRGGSGLKMVRVEQTSDGLPVFQSETRVILDREGRVVRTVGRLVPGLQAGLDLEDRISASRALQAALASVGVDLSLAALVQSSPGVLETEVRSSDPFVSGPVKSRLVLFPLGPGVAVSAWAQVIFTRGEQDLYAVVAARDARLLYRKNIRAHAGPASDRPALAAKGGVVDEARFSVYVQADGTTPAESPAPQSPTTLNPGDGTQYPEIARTTVNMSTVYDPAASPDGWIPAGGNTTTGNNVDAYLDADGNNAPDSGALDLQGRPRGNPDGVNDRDFLGSTPRDYAYTPPPSSGDPDTGDLPSTDAFQRGVVTQLFYVTNWYHDRLYGLGFDEAAGNFQNDNFGLGGSAGDRVLAEAQDNSAPPGMATPSANNANFATPPDGTSGRMQMFLFQDRDPLSPPPGPDPPRDGSLDAFIVIHELTHGLSNRLVGNAAGLNWQQGPGMGEGWSDFYALALLNPASDPDARYHSGGYATYQLGGLTDNYLYGIRRFPYSTDNTVNPLTWADVDDVTDDVAGGIVPNPLGFQFAGGNEVHNAGEVWALSLWEMRSRIVAANAGDIPTGNEIALQLVTDGLKMTPIDPTFVDARDAILAADCAANACGNEESIWGGFADRGLGYGASTSSAISFHCGVKESFSPPFLDATDVSFSDASGNANGFPDPGELLRVTVELTNPWLGASKDVPSASATIVATSPGITVVDGSSSYGAIPAQGSTTGSPFTVALTGPATCGEVVSLTLEVTSALGITETTASFRLGEPTGSGTPLTYLRTIPGGLAIPGTTASFFDRAGVADTATLADDLEILDLDFRIDDLSHTWVGDLTVEVRGPNGYGTDVVFQPAGFCASPPPTQPQLGLNCGENLVNAVFDDEAAFDLLLATEAAAPFTGSWIPVFNSPAWAPTFDPIGQLSNFDGASSAGDWSVFVSDRFLDADDGTLDSWSLVVTPQTFACGAVPDFLFADGFESGDTSAWSTAKP